MLIALISLMSVGLLSMAIGGGDDEPEEVSEDDTQPEVSTNGSNLDEVLQNPTKDLVTATSSLGYTIDDGPGTGDDADRDFIVTSDEGVGDLTVAYEAETTFQVNYGEGTRVVNASLNSDISGPDGEVVTQTVLRPDGDDALYNETTNTVAFDSQTQINLSIDAAQIGAHVAQIDLINPDDSLRFNFAADVTGNLHLIAAESETGQAGETSVAKTVYVVQTGPGITDLDGMAIADILAQDADAASGTRLLAEIHLGTDNLATNTQTTGEATYETIISNYINDTPIITSNVGWTSVSGLETDLPVAPSGGDPVVLPVNPLLPTGGDDLPVLPDDLTDVDITDPAIRALLDDLGLLDDLNLSGDLTALDGLFGPMPVVDLTARSA